MRTLYFCPVVSSSFYLHSHSIYRVFQKKMHKALKHHNFAIVSHRVTCFHQNAQKLAGNTKYDSLNIALKYCLLNSQKWLRVIGDVTCMLARHPWLLNIDCYWKNLGIINEWLLTCLGALQELVYRQKITDNDHLKQVLNSCWVAYMISQELINDATVQWSKRLLLVIRFQDGHNDNCFC